MRSWIALLCVAAAFAVTPEEVAAANRIDGFAWGNGGATPAFNAKIEIVNTRTNQVFWSGWASDPSSGYRNYFKTGALPAGTYQVRATWNGQTGRICCAVLDGKTSPSPVRMNVNMSR